MPHLDTLRECYRHNDWARDKVLALSQRLSDDELDRPFDMGPGSLRETLRHLYGAERIWFERWHERELADFPRARELNTVAELGTAFGKLAVARETFLQILGDEGLGRPFSFTARSSQSHTLLIGMTALHVCNHGVHHRAQALNMLRHLGQAVPGLDFLFFRAERPTVVWDTEVRETLRAGGLAVGDGAAEPARLSVEALQTYFAYGDWAQRRVFQSTSKLDDDALNRSFEIGLGTLRRTLLHIRDAEFWWHENWTHGPQPFEKLPETTALRELGRLYAETAARRDALLASLTNEELLREVEAEVKPGLRLRFRLGESMLQLCGHGTHHRAQALNMLRKLGAEVLELDLAEWLRSEGHTGKHTHEAES